MKKIKSYSIVRALDGLIILIAAILIVNTILSLDSVRQIRDNNIRMITDTLESFGRQEDSRFSSARHFVEWTATKDPVINDIKTESAGDFTADLVTLRSRLNDMRFNIGNDFMFFINTEPESTDSFRAISPISMTYDEYVRMRRTLVSVSLPKANMLKWSTFSTKENTYLYYVICYRGISLYSVIPVSAISDNFGRISIGRKGYISARLNGTREIMHTTGRGGSGLPFFYKTFKYNASRDGIPFSITIHADVYNSYGEQLIRQLLIIMILLSAVIFSVIYLTRLYRVILTPVENFSNQLAAITDEDSFISLDDSQISELDAANEKFRELTSEIKRLRIDMYEKELEKKKSQITFLQHQIRPHFYLNCLSTIDSMAQLSDTAGISDMVRFTSAYMRYLFQADRDFVRLEYELTHIQAYINIQNLRMGEPFIYEEVRSASELSVQIPPLLLITFVENSVKHAYVPKDDKLKIRVSATDLHNGKERIEIADSGQGFTDEDIRKFTEMAYSPDTTSPVSVDGHGIGISNSIRRLSLLYNNDFSLSFFNGTDSVYTGAHTVLVIPRTMDDIYSDEVKME